MAELIANPEPAKVIGRASECMRRLMEAGLTFEDLQQPIDDPKMRERLVCFWRSGGYNPTTTQKRAREIMGKNCFSIEEAIRHFGVNPTRQQAVALSEIPFSEATLEACKNTHILVAVFPLSILEIRGKGGKLFYNQDWYEKELFARDRGDAEWRLIRKTPVENSTNKTWQEQQALLVENEETPTARLMVYATIGHFLATGERLFEKLYVRSSDVGSGGYRVSVGAFGSGGLDIDRDWDDYRDDSLGLPSARKSE